jgi:hypothetical protein
MHDACEQNDIQVNLQTRVVIGISEAAISLGTEALCEGG